MSQKEPAGRLEVRESPNGDSSTLAELARRAYEQKRTKECLDLTRAILLIDPDNADAHWMRSSIQSEMHRDLENARAFLQQAHFKENAEMQSQPSQTAVPAVLHLDPDGKDLELPLSPDAVALPAHPADSRRRPGTRWLISACALIVLGVVVVGLPRLTNRSNPLEASRLMLRASDRSKQIVDVNAPQPDPLLMTRAAEAAPVSTPATTSSAAAPPVKTDRSTAPINAGRGTLAVSSRTSVDIYKDDAYIGSTPVSLELPAGVQTLEYRHGSLRSKVAHVIKNNETTKATVTFDVSVQINSKPWAEVFLDGVEKKALGQTPLSGVRVPIGSELIFENPQFQPKKYRVTGDETGIQIAFP